MHSPSSKIFVYDVLEDGDTQNKEMTHCIMTRICFTQPICCFLIKKCPLQFLFYLLYNPNRGFFTYELQFQGIIIICLIFYRR